MLPRSDMLEDFRIKVFVSVSEHGSFTKAATALGVSQPAVSQNIAELERLTGCRLFERRRGEVVLTGEGQVFKDYSTRLLSLCTEAEDMFARISPVTVRFTSSEEVYRYVISPALETFSRLHPDVVFENTLFGEPDFRMTMVPASDPMPDTAVSRIRMSMMPPCNVSALSGVNERTSYFDLLFEPSEAFSCTRLCRILHALLKSV